MKNHDRFRSLGICVIIPTYNNGGTIVRVVRDVLQYCADVVVVNDGSTDETSTALNELEGVDVLHLPKNRGKGVALRTGFRHAFAKGFRYAITIDSDGQHMADDLLVFADKIERHPNALIIGARNMTVANVPKKSSFGRRFSNFWFWFETGKRAPDTQSGYRLYPLKAVAKMRYFTWRYEFEIEVLVRCAWKGIRITTIPVKVYYAPREERVSHFRPFIDFTRVSILNIWLVLISLLIWRPFKFIMALNKKNIKDFFYKHVLAPGESNSRKTISVMVGVFLGIFPIWGWQIAAAIFVSVFFKLNRMITIVSSNISIPPMIPLVVWGSYKIGGLFIRQDTINLKYHSDITLGYISLNLLQYLVGAVILAVITALVFGLVTYILLSIFRKDVKEEKRDLIVIKKKKSLPRNRNIKMEKAG
jgi:glycosyltransferase involved in cell wall biosynthesis